MFFTRPCILGHFGIGVAGGVDAPALYATAVASTWTMAPPESSETVAVVRAGAGMPSWTKKSW